MKTQLISILVATILILGSMTTVDAQQTPSQKSQQIVNEAITKALPNGNWTLLDEVSVSIYGNGSSIPVIDNGTGTNTTIPPVVNNTNGNTTDPDNNTTDPDSNQTNNFIIGTIADIDDNSGLVTQAKLMKAEGVQAVLINGDFCYKNSDTTEQACAKAIKILTDNGFTKNQIYIAVGNHDSCTWIKQFLGIDNCVKDFYLGTDKSIQVITMDGKETGMTCGSDSQFNKVKDMLSENERLVTIVMIHEPFVTVKSDHPANGGFSCYQELFKTENVDLVTQGHNHNYQYVEIDGVGYLIAGTGTHDKGSSMYDCDSSSFNGNIVKCITGTNGFTKLNIETVGKTIDGEFISNSGNVVHQWSLN